MNRVKKISCKCIYFQEIFSTIRKIASKPFHKQVDDSCYLAPRDWPLAIRNRGRALRDNHPPSRGLGCRYSKVISYQGLCNCQESWLTQNRGHLWIFRPIIIILVNGCGAHSDLLKKSGQKTGHWPNFWFTQFRQGKYYRDKREKPFAWPKRDSQSIGNFVTGYQGLGCTTQAL